MAIAFTWTDVGSQIMAILNNTTYLPDPWEDATGRDRGDWWHDDEPKVAATFPKGQIEFDGEDFDNKSLGEDFQYQHSEVFNIKFFAKNGFKYTDENGVEYTNRPLVSYFLERVFYTLKKTQLTQQFHIKERGERTLDPPGLKSSDADIWVGEMMVTFQRRHG